MRECVTQKGNVHYATIETNLMNNLEKYGDYCAEEKQVAKTEIKTNLDQTAKQATIKKHCV